MGCISSKQARSESPDLDSPVTIRENGPMISISSKRIEAGFGQLEKIKEKPEKEKGEESSVVHRSHESWNLKPSKRAAFSIKFGRLVEGEHVAAGWPGWLSAVAGEAVEGWLPLRSDPFERLEKIGQGTYSSVYRARDVESGKMVALKKVRFDNFQPDSVRFMAREITILRRLDHPNLMKLEGIITSRVSYSIYFVFEYMEHDLSGLLSCPDIKFSDSQIKCYMKQLLHGLEHCHSRGILHRDIKASNILVNNEGVLKIADFGLANFVHSKNKQPLTNRVVTLWYRPPELLLGSTNYGTSVDMWSVGCVFAELFIGRPILKGRTEVEQLHKIFKLCGSPADDYWKKSKLPLATMFKPQQGYESTLRERCKELPKTAVSLIETLLSIDPHKRGTAASALDSEYFTTKPYACDPSILPKYPPNKEIDAKFREEARRKRAGGGVRVSAASRNPRRVRKTLQEPSTFCKVVPTEEVDANIQVVRRSNRDSAHSRMGKGATELSASLKPVYDTVSEASQATEASQADSIQTVPVQITPSSSFAWATKRRKNDISSARIYGRIASRTQSSSAFDPSPLQQVNDNLASRRHRGEDFARIASQGHEEITRRTMHRQHSLSRPDSFDSSNVYEAQDLSMDYHDQQERFRFSGPLLSQSHRLDGRQESHTRQAVGRSRFYRDL